MKAFLAKLQMASRRDFHLPADDVQFLDSLGLEWELVSTEGQRALLIKRFLLPIPFSPSEVTLKIKLPAEYSSGAALDMFFTDIAVIRTDGKAIPNFSQAGMFDGKIWHQWSRHYPDKCPWRPGVNTLVTHLAFIQSALDREAAL